MLREVQRSLSATNLGLRRSIIITKSKVKTNPICLTMKI